MLVLFIEIDVIGDKELLNKLKSIENNLKSEPNNISRDLANEMKRLSRFYLTKRFEFDTRKSWESIRIVHVRRGVYQLRGGENYKKVPYFRRLEFGLPIHGWHFVKMRGRGREGKGFAAPGGRIPIRKSGHFMRDAEESVRSRALKIAINGINRRIGLR